MKAVIQMQAAAPHKPYLHSLCAAMVAALFAAIAIAVIDIALAASRTDLSITPDFVLITCSLYALPALCIGGLTGLVVGAWRVTMGDGVLSRTYKRLLQDPAADTRAAGATMAAMLVSLVFAGLVAIAALTFLGDVQRKGVGALLVGMSSILCLAVCAPLGLPIYRITRHVARFVPRTGRISRTLVTVLAAFLVAALALTWIVTSKLDWRALNLGAPALVLTFGVLAISWCLLWYGPLGSHLRQRIPARGALTATSVVITLVVSAWSLRGTPSKNADGLLTDYTSGARVLVDIGRRLTDRDGDRYGTFLGGGDCDDSNPAIHPEARDVPGNGIDENCRDGDRPVPKQIKKPNQKTPLAPPAPASDGNVLLIAIDTLRADRLGVAGYRRDGKTLTPHLDEFSKAAVWFTQAYAQAPNTPRSFPSMFTSRFPSQVKVDKQFANYSNVLDENHTVFEALRDAGLHTIGFSSHFYFSEKRGIRQGFVEYDNEGAKNIAGSNKDIASPRTVPKVIAKLEQLAAAKTRFAMFVHLFEPHSTYMKHPEYPITLRKIPGLIQKYDYEIAFVDQWVGKLLAAVTRLKLDKNTTIVIVSDHGEAFGVHRVAGQAMFFHGQTLYDELLRVPLIAKVPGVAPRTIDGPVMLIDVAPTILHALNIKRPSTFVGRSLLPAMTTGQLTPQPAFGELLRAPSWNHAAKMIVSADGRHQLIHRISDRRYELYDMQVDEQQRNNIYRKRKDIADKLNERLGEWMDVTLAKP